MTALSSEALRKLGHVEPQALAFLTEVGLDASAHPALVQQLDRVIGRLVAELPQNLSGWRRGPDLRSLREVRVDHLGSVGTRLMLDRLNVSVPDDVFIESASAKFPRMASGEISRSRVGMPAALENTPHQRRIFCYAEYEFFGTQAPLERCEGDHSSPALKCQLTSTVLQPLRGRMMREHGFQGLRMWQKGWLRALSLPVNPHVDRSVCAEFQVLNEMCDFVNQHGLADDPDDCRNVSGSVKVLVSTTPCLSCVCAVKQFSLLFPHVSVQFGCIQPWHTQGGADGAMHEASWTGNSQDLQDWVGPVQWVGGKIVEHLRQGSPQQGLQKLAEEDLIETESSPQLALGSRIPEPLLPGSASRMQAACCIVKGDRVLASVDLSRAATWEDVRHALQIRPAAELSEMLRAHKVSVKPELLLDRVERVVSILRKTV